MFDLGDLRVDCSPKDRLFGCPSFLILVFRQGRECVLLEMRYTSWAIFEYGLKRLSRRGDFGWGRCFGEC